MDSGKKVFAAKALDKSDVFINRKLVRLRFYLDTFIFKLSKIPVFLDILSRNIINGIKSLKNRLILKIVDFLNLDNVKNIERNKGSVSLFLKEISDDKETK